MQLQLLHHKLLNLFIMKHLSRDEMKKVMGGDVPQTGCTLKCCFTPLVGGLCHVGHVAQFNVESCEGAGNASCAGGFYMACWCFGGPAM